jgi:ParB family chromosome partitioning protein
VRAEGWRWIEVGFGYPQGSYSWRRVFPAVREPTKEESQEKEQLEARLEAIAVALEGGEDEALATETGGIEQRLAELEGALDAFTPEQRALAGAAVWLDHQGTAVVDRGFVRPEDEPAPEPNEPAAEIGTDPAPDSMAGEPAAPAAAPDAGDAAEPEEESLRPLSERLVEDLTAHRTAALRLALSEQPQTALVAVVHALAGRLFYGRSWDPASCLDLQPHEAHLQASSDTILASPAVTAFEAARRRWRARLPGEEAELWDWLLAADPDTHLELLAFCTGASLDATRRRSNPPGRGALAHADRLATTLALDLRPHWRPTRAAFLDKVSKRHILAAVSEVAGEAKAEAWSGLKKEALIELAEPVLTEARWLPAPLRAAAATGDTPPADDSTEPAGEREAGAASAAQAA